jgi:hypothetical protein
LVKLNEDKKGLGYNIVKYLGRFSMPVVIGTGFFSSFNANVADFVE